MNPVKLWVRPGSGAILVRPWGVGTLIALAMLSFSVLSDATLFEVVMLGLLWMLSLAAAVMEHQREAALQVAEQQAQGELGALLAAAQADRAQLAQRNAELDEANHRLEQFTAAAAHQLKSGPRMIRGLVEALQEECKDSGDDCAQIMAHIRALADEMLSVVAALQDMGRLHAATVSVREEQLIPLLQEAVERASRGRAGEVIFEVAPLRVLTSKQIFVEALANLIDNGWKFNRSDSPTVFITSSVHEGRVVLLIEDNGIGLPPNTPHLFEMFRRHTSEFPGSGIGLAAAYRMIEKAGGDLTLLPSSGGAKFRIRLAVVA